MAPRRPPNVLLVNCDDLGYGDLGCHGSTAHDTPRIDELARGGVRLTDFYAASPVCSPSRAALLTGCLPPRVGFGDFDGAPVLFPGHPMGLDPREPTLSSVLSDAGYATALVGKWHCGDQPGFLPTDHGFDHWFGLPYSNDMGRQAWYENLPPMAEFMSSIGFELPLAEFPPLPLMDGDDVVEQQPDQADLTSRYVEDCIDFMRNHAQEPFFLYLAHMYVHVPLYVEERFALSSRHGRYGAAVHCIDWALGALLDELDRLGLTEDTIVVFTSDNGSRAQGEGGSNAPLRGVKGTTWEGGQRVPCIVSWPGVIEPAKVDSTVLSGVDLLPTLVELCGLDPVDPQRIDGRSFVDVLTGEGRSEPSLFPYYRGNDLEAIRVDRWKLHLRRFCEPVCELYDLEADPGESNDLSAEHADVVARLRSSAAGVAEVLGDASGGIVGSGVRPAGRVDDPRPLIEYDPDHPYVVAEYDLLDRG